MPTKQFKVKWAESEWDVRAEKRQGVARRKLFTLLKRDGFEMSHTDDDGFTVYLQTGKPVKQQATRKPDRKPWLRGMAKVIEGA